MLVRFAIAAALTLSLAVPAASPAAPTGVQWTPDSKLLLVNKDVGAERWAITLVLADYSASGNIFFTDGRAPAFVWCENTGQTFDASAGELDLQYRCFGADAGFGGFASSDWTPIGDDVVLPLSFFIPEAETCDNTGALNGPTASAAGNYWNCGGSAGSFHFQVFANGTGVSDPLGPFEYDAIDEACRVAAVNNGPFLDLEYSPSRDHLTIYEAQADGSELIVSECERVDF
jgi:hypothetical protein